MTGSVFTAGDRYVWSSATYDGDPFPPLRFSGTYVADGPAPYVTVRHDGHRATAQVFADQLRRVEEP